MPGPRSSVTLRLTARHDAPSTARRTVAQMCGHLPALVDDAMLLTSELCTNAVLYAGGVLTVCIECDDQALAVSVTDDNPAPPRVPVPDTEGDGGRGLFLVDQCSHDWGWRDLPGGRGKIVWFRLGPTV